MNFEELSAHRRLLQDFCARHESSMLAFRLGDNEGFALTVDEPYCGRMHLTTTATCIESLLACPARYRTVVRNPVHDAQHFARAAIERDAEEWKSDESAHIYCRCRGLPLTMDHVKEYDVRLTEHVRRIIRQLEHDPTRFAVGEADVKEAPSAREIDDAKRSWYPPNAFHTYWALDILSGFKKRFEKEYLELESDAGIRKIIAGMLLWSRRTLGYQTSLHAAESSILDSDQLAWSLATLLKFESPFPADLGEQDFLREALKQLFRTQLPIGTWRHYRSLFHYKAAGNAYCYVYETFAVLLQIALDGNARRQLFREALRPYVDNLTRLWRYAESTCVALRAQETGKPSAVGWCSGHRLNQTAPESWATASVFSFAQAFRRLLGVWSREAAARELNLLKPVFDVPAEEILKRRGNTWTEEGKPGVAKQLYTMFVNPALMHRDREVLEPDTEPIEEHQARSAILFGPPGTSKTTLCGAIARSIGWDYIELHASHFVADGLQNVQKKADDIFRRLMEIDRTVVLFDEIDELVREREDEHDAFGRFLTTSMLPKLAELWKQRKIIYFVATNHIRYFDVAITRSQRFDALILVSPPAYSPKIERLKEILAGLGCKTTFDDLEKRIREALKLAGKVDPGENEKEAKEARERALNENERLAKFVLLRWDQLDELASNLRTAGMPNVDEEVMKKALDTIADRKLLQRAPYVDFVNDLDRQARDFDKELVWIAEGFDKEYEPEIVKRDGKLWLVVRHASSPPRELHGFRLDREETAAIYYER